MPCLLWVKLKVKLPFSQFLNIIKRCLVWIFMLKIVCFANSNVVKCDNLSDFQTLCKYYVLAKLPYMQWCIDRSEVQFISIFSEARQLQLIASVCTSLVGSNGRRTVYIMYYKVFVAVLLRFDYDQWHFSTICGFIPSFFKLSVFYPYFSEFLPTTLTVCI